MTHDGNIGCVLVAAGRGERLGSHLPKAFVELRGRPLIWYALQAIAASTVRDTLVVVPVGYEGAADDLLNAFRPAPGTWSVTTGGATRQESVARGLAALPERCDVVLVHDAARCLTPPGLYNDVARAVRERHDAVVPGLAVVDTLKRVDGSGLVIGTPDRAELRAVQTPQGFRREVLARAHAAAADRGDTEASDDASLVERLALEVHVVPGHDDAFKITRPHDLLLAEAVLAERDDLGAASLGQPEAGGRR